MFTDYPGSAHNTCLEEVGKHWLGLGEGGGGSGYLEGDLLSSFTSERLSCCIYIYIYYPPEVRRVKYCGLEVFLLQYFPLVPI